LKEVFKLVKEGKSTKLRFLHFVSGAFNILRAGHLEIKNVYNYEFSDIFNSVKEGKSWKYKKLHLVLLAISLIS
jgi:hypothetical protein